jgi:mono/diheme cytochrome c family protein
VTGPDGYIYFSTSQIDPAEGSPRPNYDMILRLRPSGSSDKPLLSQKLIENKPILKSTQKQTAGIMFHQLCASCHGDNLQGTNKTQNLLAGKFKYGSTKASIIKNITNGITDQGMPAWNGAISKGDINQIANYIYKKTRNSIKHK